MIDWTAVWGVVGPAIIGLATYLKMRKPNQAKVAAAVAEARADANNSDTSSAVVTLLRQEVERLSQRQTALEKREGRLIRHLYRLEGMMHAKGIDPPPFDIDGDEPIKAGGTT